MSKPKGHSDEVREEIRRLIKEQKSVAVKRFDMVKKEISKLRNDENPEVRDAAKKKLVDIQEVKAVVLERFDDMLDEMQRLN